LGKVHARVANLRRDLLHRISTELARGYTSITIEDLNVPGCSPTDGSHGQSPMRHSGSCVDS
jgi:hypothetical protein